VDIEGRLIGVTTAIATTSQSNSGVGFVIPASIVQRVVPVLIEAGRYEHTWLGMAGLTLTPGVVEAAGLLDGQEGVLVLSVTSGGPAQKAGLRGGSRQGTLGGATVAIGGDVITAVDGQAVESFEARVSYLYNETEVGQKVALTVLRSGQEQTLQVTLGARPGQD
jgi:2-alkenal reductase